MCRLATREANVPRIWHMANVSSYKILHNNLNLYFTLIKSNWVQATLPENCILRHLASKPMFVWWVEGVVWVWGCG